MRQLFYSDENKSVLSFIAVVVLTVSNILAFPQSISAQVAATNSSTSAVIARKTGSSATLR